MKKQQNFIENNGIPNASIEKYEYVLAYMGLTQVRKSYLAKQILQLLTLLAIAHRVRTEVSPEVVGEGAGTRFPHPRDVLVCSRGFALWFTTVCCSIFAQIQLEYIFPISALFYSRMWLQINSLSKHLTNTTDSHIKMNPDLHSFKP